MSTIEAGLTENTVNDPKALAHACGPAGLSFEQLQAIPLLVSGRTGREVAAEIGCAETSISRWRCSDDVFIEEYTRQRTLIYESGLQRAYSRIDGQLDADDPKLVQGAAKVRLEHHAQMARANQTVTHTIILDKLQAALAGRDAEAVDAEWQAVAEGEGQSELVDALPSTNE